MNLSKGTNKLPLTSTSENIFKEALIKLIAFMDQQDYNEHNQRLTVLSKYIKGFNQSFFNKGSDF